MLTGAACTTCYSGGFDSQKNIIDDINFRLDNACLSRLSIAPLEQRLVERLNDTSHLEGLG